MGFLVNTVDQSTYEVHSNQRIYKTKKPRQRTRRPKTGPWSEFNAAILLNITKEHEGLRIPGTGRVFVKTGPLFHFCMMRGNCLLNRAVSPTFLPPIQSRFLPTHFSRRGIGIYCRYLFTREIAAVLAYFLSATEIRVL